MKRTLLFALLTALPILLLPAGLQAQSCSPGYYNMLDWMTLSAGSSKHFTGNANPLYTVDPSGGLFWWIKGDFGGEGYPWDVQYYDPTYIYQWITELNWNDPKTFKAFATKNDHALDSHLREAGRGGHEVR